MLALIKELLGCKEDTDAGFYTKEYIEYIAGDLPIILSAPHGGDMVPEEIPDRTQGTTVRDSRTEELAWTFFAQALAEALETYIETHYGFDLQTGPR